MFSLFKQRCDFQVAALFRGTLAPRLEELSFPETVSIKVLPRENTHWAAELHHPQWGMCSVQAMRVTTPLLPRAFYDHDIGLTNSERLEIEQAGSLLLLDMKSPTDNMLRERKHVLRFAGAVLGDDGLGVYDLLSGRTWSRAALETELSHDADLDVEALFCLHHVVDDDNTDTWLHSHGLGVTGAHDFDILNPSEDLTSMFQFDMIRGIAFALLEGRAKPGDARFTVARPDGVVSLIEVTRFMRSADARWVDLRDDPNGLHQDRRVVLCEPTDRFRFFRRGRMQPSGFLSGPLPDGLVIDFSSDATELMAERARAMYALLQQLADEFAQWDLPVLVKLGYAVDGSSAESHREHLWFQVHGFDQHSIDATLLNQPYNIARFSEGQRDKHESSRLTDWQIITPVGAIHPRSLKNLRKIRENPDVLRE